ncbi:TPA: DUF3693 domain-containing protein [Vibrio parahaemolyticus]
MKAVWEGTAKKFNGLGLAGISMACTGLALVDCKSTGTTITVRIICVMLNKV